MSSRSLTQRSQVRIDWERSGYGPAKNDPRDLRRQVIFPTRKMTANKNPLAAENRYARPSSALSIYPGKDLACAGMAVLNRLAECPPGSPAQYLVARGLAFALKRAMSTLQQLDSRPSEILQKVEALINELETAMEDFGQAEAQSSLSKLKGKYPVWWALSEAGKDQHSVGQTYLGLKILHALHERRPLRPSAITRYNMIVNGDELTDEQVQALLHEQDPEAAVQHDWIRDFLKAYRDVIRAYAPSKPAPPSADFNSRITGQLLDGVLAATAARRAGARNHREFSQAQIDIAFKHIAHELNEGTLAGCLGVLVSITGFTPDLAVRIPITSGGYRADCNAFFQIDKGILFVDHRSLIREAAAAMAGCLDSTMTCTKPVPAALWLHLRRRHEQNHHATTIGELFPEAHCPEGEEAIFPNRNMIRPSWARYRNSVGTFLRDQGFDNLLASAISGRFWHVPQSKLYYASLSRPELQLGFDRFYSVVGWGDAVEIENGPAFGCRVVPTEQSILSFDHALVDACIRSQPGQHAGLQKLIEHHNEFMRLVGFRLSILLALRESRELPLLADFDERCDRWVAIHDKDVPGREYPLPMPLGSFTRETVGAVRAHCRALRGRMLTMRAGKSALAQWCFSVGAHKPVPMLMTAKSSDSIRTLGTADVLSGPAFSKNLPPDFGRKFMENALRLQGLQSTEVDALLRHSVLGQAFQSSTSHQHSLSTWLRTTKAVDQIAAEYFGEVAHGLAKA